MFKIPSQDRKTFKRHFIDRVIFELRFSPVAFDWDILERRFAEVFVPLNFRSITKEWETAFKIEPPKDKNKPTNGPTLHTDSTPRGFTITNDELGLALAIKPDRLIFICRKYTGFEEIWSQFENCVTAATSVLGSLNYVWMGIRKVNELAIDESGRPGYVGAGVNENFFAPIKKGIFMPENIVTAKNSYSLRRDDSRCFVNVEVVKMASGNQYNLIVDLDVNESLTNVRDFDEIGRISSKINRTLFELFCWVVSQDLIEAMEI